MFVAQNVDAFPTFGYEPIADGVKLFLKEDFTPNHVRKSFYWLAPALLIAPALITVAVVPFGSTIVIGGRSIDLDDRAGTAALVNE